MVAKFIRIIKKHKFLKFYISKVLLNHLFQNAKIRFIELQKHKRFMYTSYFIALKFKYNTKAKLKQYGPNLNIRMVNTIKRTMTFWAGTRNY